jgi:hypothetical protein
LDEPISTIIDTVGKETGELLGNDSFILCSHCGAGC